VAWTRKIRSRDASGQYTERAGIKPYEEYEFRG
jgi:hypothetical protein